MKKITYFFTKYFIRTVFLPFLHIDYQQLSSLVGDGPKIFAANHPSTLDPIFIMSILKTTVSILLTQSVFYLPIIGLILKKTGHIPVADGQGSLAYQKAKDKLIEGQSILIFPEGHLSEQDGSTKPFFSGAIRLAMETKAPIVPLGISIQTNRVKTKQIKIKNKIDQARFYLRGKYVLTIGKQLSLTGNTTNKHKIDGNKNKLMLAINQLIAESHTRLTNYRRS